MVSIGSSSQDDSVGEVVSIGSSSQDDSVGEVVSIGSSSQDDSVGEMDGGSVVVVAGALTGATIEMDDEVVLLIGYGAFTGATTTLVDGLALLDEFEPLIGSTRVVLEVTVLGGTVGGLIDPPGVLPAFVHPPVAHFSYSVIALPPPQLDRGSPAHFMLQFPRMPGLGAASGLSALPQ
jgi:hypothetical protein